LSGNRYSTVPQGILRQQYRCNIPEKISPKTIWTLDPLNAETINIINIQTASQQISYFRFQQLIIFTAAPLAKKSTSSSLPVYTDPKVNKMKASDILALLPVTPSNMPQIATSTEPPTRQSLKNFQESIQDQAMAITTSDPLLSFLGLVLNDSIFQTLSHTATSYTPPADPGNAPNATSTGAVIAEATRVFVMDQDKYNTYVQFKIILNLMITTNCPSDLKDPITKFCRCTPLELLDHLWTTFGTITSKDLTDNWSLMNAQWNPPTPIADLFQQLQDGQTFTTDGHKDITDSQLLHLCYDNVNNTGLFGDALKIWRAKPEASKT
jgi:hypothetical protein